MYRVLATALALTSAVALIAAPQLSASKPARPVLNLHTPPPTIGHVISRPLCVTLYGTVRPAIARMIENNDSIAKSQPLFEQFNMDMGNGDTAQTSRQLELLRMENLVDPLANNIIAVETQLNNPNIFPKKPRTADEKRLQDIREKLLETLAAQRLALDIVNGFVTTQQLGDLQQVGEGYIGAITGSGEMVNSDPRATPNPIFDNPNIAGVRQDPHYIDPTNVPGLTLGYNPIRRLIDGLKWTRALIDAKGNLASRAVMDGAAICNPPASPNPVRTR